MCDYVALGTENGVVVVTDYLGRIKAALRLQSTAAYGSVSAITFSADHLVLVAGYSQGYVIVWDWIKGTTISVTRPLQSSDKSDVVGHPLGTAVTCVGFVGVSKHRYISGSAGGHVLYHHIIKRLLTTMSTEQLTVPNAGSDLLFEAAALPYGSYECATDEMGLVAILTSTSLTILKTRHGIIQQYRASYQLPLSKPGVVKRAFTKRPYAGCMSWLPALKHKKTATSTDPAESGFNLPKLVYTWGSSIYVLGVQLEYDVSGNGTPLGNVPPRVRFEKELEWAAVEDVVLCRWIEAGVLFYMTQSQQVFVFETELGQETKICASPPSIIAGRPWTTLATGIEAEPSYTQTVSVYRRRIFTLCGTSSIYTGRLLSWAERLELLEEQGQFIPAITLATGFYQGRTSQIVVGLPRSRRLGDASQKRLQVLVGSRLTELMRNALRRTFTTELGHPISDSEAQALASICIEACLALNDMQTLFGDVFEFYASNLSTRRVFFETIEPFILSGEITNLPPQVLNSMVDSYGASPSLIRRLGEVLANLNLTPGEFDVDRVLSSCRRHRLWRTFARVWLGIGDPIAPITSVVAAASVPDCRESGSADQSPWLDTSYNNDDSKEIILLRETAAFDDEAPGVVIFDYLDAVIRGRYYPDGQPIKPQDRAEKYSTLVTELIFPPVEEGQVQTNLQQTFGTLLALLDLGTEQLLATLRHIIGDPFAGFINLIVKPSSAKTTKNGDRTLRRASQVKPFVQIVVDTFYILVMATYKNAPSDVLTNTQIGQLSSFALTLYATRFPLIYLRDETVVEWSNVLLLLDDAPTRVEREYAFELLFNLNPPRSYGDYIERVRSAGFFRVLENIYRTLGQYEDALCTFLEHPDYTQHRAVFVAIEDLAATAEPSVLSSIVSFAKNNASELVELDADAFVETVESVSLLDHDVVIGALNSHPQSQFAYMRSLLDPVPSALSQSSEGPVIASADERAPPRIGLPDEQHIVLYPFKALVPNDFQQLNRFPQAYHERYLELMCQFNPGGVLQYLRKHADISPEPFRLAYVQSVCSQYGVNDGLVWALVRLGDFSGALQTLLRQTDQETESIKAAVPGGISATEASALSEVDRERLTDHLDIAAHNIDGCVDVCKTALTRLGKDSIDAQPVRFFDQTSNTSTSADSTSSNNAKTQNDYRSLVSTQLCDLWLALLRRTLGYLHATGRTIDSLALNTATTATREAWLLVSKRQRWMLQSVLDALISAASPASSFISLRKIIQQLIAGGPMLDKDNNSNNMVSGSSAGHTGAARSLDIAEIQHLLAVAVSAYKSEAQLMALTNVLVDYDLFTTFAQLVRSQRQGWTIPAEATQSSRADSYTPLERDAASLCCGKCREPLFIDQRHVQAMTSLRKQISQYYESNTLRVLDLHVFEDSEAQWQWMKLRTASTTYNEQLASGPRLRRAGSGAGSEQMVLFKCGHGFHRRCIASATAAGGKAAETAVGSHTAFNKLPLECLRCACRDDGIGGSGHRHRWAPAT
ncbi:hypothetical protein COEREDRAFT_82734 [Coemansia reversa NRRL 1564]|uniref:Uncharacterized protein n=1 Tax=Coemansia reversa (strain ATCC 12441 / NRRL 1564) TaxID=763665 RepID=A0A2G5B644_COERN|nr:hypothetical protein COEREDRAFT_82734 [Coemansia reversa NRRL 1564]|eukprot:PIA14462.1 hypothetical protein COEREDRAFT_82734 [Coemansia reversa NRRL 1564]